MANTRVFYDPEAGMRGFQFGVGLVKNFRETAELVRKRAEEASVREKMAEHAKKEMELSKEQKLREAQIDEQRALLAAQADGGDLVKLKTLEAKSAAYMGGLLKRQMALGNELIAMGTEASQKAGQPLVQKSIDIQEQMQLATHKALLEDELAENERKFRGKEMEADRQARAKEGDKNRDIQWARVGTEREKLSFERTQFQRLMEHRAAELGLQYDQLDQRIREMSVDTAYKLVSLRQMGLEDRLNAIIDYQKTEDPRLKALILATADFSEDEIELLTEQTVEEVRKSAQEIAQEIAKEEKFITSGSGDKEYLADLKRQAREVRSAERKAMRLRMSRYHRRGQGTGRNIFQGTGEGTRTVSQTMAGRGQEGREYTQGEPVPSTGRRNRR